MYCATTPLIRATRFFEVCQEDLPPQISNNDKELVKYIVKQMEIAYQLMMATYKIFKKPEDPFFPDEWLTTDQAKLN